MELKFISVALPLAAGSLEHLTGRSSICIYSHRFEVNLKNYQDDIVLHVNPRLDDNALVLNSGA